MRTLLIAILIILGSPSLPANAAQDEALNFAQESARLAGSARYCKLDEEMVEAFINQSLGAIARLAEDEVDRALARIEFKNTLDASGFKAPEEGCDAFTARFRRILSQ